VILDEPFSGLDPVNQQVMEDIIRDMARRNRTVLFSTHVMQHAERLCERILLIAQGRKIFDGTIREAKAIFPRRIRIETPDNIELLRNLPQIVSIQAFESANGKTGGNGSHQWEIALRENADTQALISACFEQKIRLQSFNQSEPSLHEIFVHLVGPEAKEASFR
jgi:ABC-2 type transport system ATP-binding protein